MDKDWKPQRIARLTPLDDVLARIDAVVKPVPLRSVGIWNAIGRVPTLERPPGVRPAAAIAWRDGWAVSADLTADASSYNPVPLTNARFVETGDCLSAEADAVASEDDIVDRPGGLSIIAPVAPGEGVLPTGADLDGRSVLHGGQRLTAVQAAVRAAAGINEIEVRSPRFRVVKARPADDPILDSIRTLIAEFIRSAGGEVEDPAHDADPAQAMADPRADGVIVIGGTGSGRRDTSVTTLTSVGHVDVHGVALSPGETAAFGLVGVRPVLLIPGRLDAALAVWLTFGRRMLARLLDRSDPLSGRKAVLSRKVASSLGMAEVIPVRLHDGGAEPLAAAHWPLQVMADADGWILVPADSEGSPAGALVVVRSFS